MSYAAAVTGEVGAQSGVTPTPTGHQVNVYVKGPDGKPVEGMTVALHAMVPFPLNYVPGASDLGARASALTDAAGYAYFDNVLPWVYWVIGEKAGLISEVKLFTVPVEVLPPYTSFTFKLNAYEPPVILEVDIKTLTVIDKALVQGLVDASRGAILGLTGVEFVSCSVSGSTVVVKYRVTHASPIAAETVIAAISAVTLAIIALAILIGVITILVYGEKLGEKLTPAFAWIAIALIALAAIYAMQKGVIRR